MHTSLYDMVGSRSYPLLARVELTDIPGCPIFTSPNSLNAKLHNILSRDVSLIVNPVVTTQAAICPDLTEGDLVFRLIMVPTKDVVRSRSLTEGISPVQTPLAVTLVPDVGFMSVDMTTLQLLSVSELGKDH